MVENADSETQNSPALTFQENPLFLNESQRSAQIVEKGLITEELKEAVEQVIYFFILAINMIGVVTNVINILVFYKQGLRTDSSNIGLFSLAICDFFSCFVMVPASLCYVSNFLLNRVSFFVCIVMYATFFLYIHDLFSRITCWLTVYVSVERSLIVLMPLRFNRIITPRVTTASVLVIYSFFFILYAPYMGYLELYWVFLDHLNASVPIITEHPEGKIAVNVISLVSGTILSSVATVMIAITTVLLVYKLKVSSQIRKSMVGGGSSGGGSGGGAGGCASSEKDASKANNDHSRKDHEVVKSVTMVTALFLVCLSMSHIPSMSMAFLPGLTVSGVNRNLFYIVYAWKFLFDAINSSANFFFFIRVSSRYRATFDSIFRTGGKDRK